MRGTTALERLQDTFLDELCKKPLGELAKEYDLEIESINDLFTLAEAIDSAFNQMILQSKDLGEEEVSNYRVVDCDSVRYFFRKPVVILGERFHPFVDLRCIGKHQVAVYNFGVEPYFNVFGSSYVSKQGYTLGDAISEQKDKASNNNVQYNFDEGYYIGDDDYSDDDEDEYEEYDDVFK